MIKARTWLSLLLVSASTVAATASCGSDEASGAGSAGSSANGGSSGGGIIGASGKTGGVGRAGANGTAGGLGRAGSDGALGPGGADGSGATMLGATCGADADCGAGLTCLTMDGGKLGGASPAGGLCTLACTADADCDPLEAGAGCVNFGTMTAPAAYCLQTCTQGEPQDVNSKCNGRPDVACTALSDTATFCLPLCRADAECGAGSYCDPGTGLCSKTKPSGLPVGSACDPNAATDPCEGYCITTSAMGVMPETGNCVQVCSAGLPCMYSHDAAPKPGGFCLPGTQTGGTLDLGVCEPTCACTGDCKLPGRVCRAWDSANAGEQQLKGVLGSDGLCLGDASDTMELTTCGAGGAAP